MTDESLLLLENLTYLDSGVASAAGVKLPNLTTAEDLKDYLSVFDDDALAKLESSDTRMSGFMTGSEWAATIRALKSDPSITELKCQNYDSQNFAMCYTDPSGNAYVTFQGTANGDEWIDNFQGLNVSDTQCQKNALAYIESLPYDDITVVGHSKGGNKAMYVAITSDKVGRCLAMDGQGFSQEFLDKYRAEIELRGGNITNYSLDTDYVHILLFPIPGAEQRFYQNGGEGGLRNHCPTAYYQFIQDEDGHWYILSDENGVPSMTELPCENEGIASLHDFTCFILNVMPDGQKEQAVEYLGVLLALAMDGDYSIKIGGVSYTHDNLTEYILSDQKTLAMVMGYFLKYADVSGFGEEETLSLLRAFGFGELLDSLKEGFENFQKEHPIYAKLLGITGDGIMGLLGLLLDQLRDGKQDHIIEALLGFLGDWLKKKLQLKDLDLVQIWREIESTYGKIGDVDRKTATQNGSIAGTKILNYSKESYDLLMQTIASINGQTIGSVSGWSAYASEEWYGKLLISIAIQGIGSYFSHIAEINESCKAQIDRIYGDVRSIDTRMAAKLRKQTEAVNRAASNLRTLASGIG